MNYKDVKTRISDIYYFGAQTGLLKKNGARALKQAPRAHSIEIKQLPQKPLALFLLVVAPASIRRGRMHGWGHGLRCGRGALG